MTPVTSDVDLLAHVDEDQRVWFGSGMEPAKNSGLSPERFAAEDWVLGGRSLKIAGAWENALLIQHLWERKLAADSPLRIYLGRPASCEDPADFICRMRQLSDPASCGGWHAMTSCDYVTYRLITAMRECRRWEATDMLRAFLRAHPAFPALSFLPGMDAWWSAVFLCYVVDPRWWVNPRYPDRSSTYYRMLGLGRADSAKELWQAYMSGHPRSFGMSSTVLSWVRRGDGSTVPEPRGSRDFLVRVWRQYDDRAHGLAVAARLFARFVRDVWLDNLTPPRRYRPGKHPKAPRRLQPCDTYSPQLFVPEHFFSHPATLGAWRAHLRALRKQQSGGAD